MTLLSRAVSLLQTGDAVAARSLLLEAPETDQRDFLLGACAHALGEIPQAVQCFADALRRNPAHASAASALGSLYAGLGRKREAEALFRQTLTRVEDAQLRFNLAVMLEDRGDNAAALAEYSAVLRLAPGHYGARHNRAGLHAREQRLQDAADDYRELVRQHPEFTLPWHNLGELELGQGRYEEAERLLTEVLVREPVNGKACLSLAVAQAAQGLIAQSHASFERLKAMEPARWEEARARLNGRRGHDAGIDPRLLFLLRTFEHLGACDWRYWTRWGEVFRDFCHRPSDGDLIALAYPALLAPQSAAEQLALMTAIGRQIEAAAAPFKQTPTVGSAQPERLRIGYIGPLLERHVTGLNLRRFFAAHPPHSTEVFVISTGRPGNDPAWPSRIELRDGVNWIDCADQDDATIAARLCELRLDVLVDIATYSNDPRPEVIAARPAPVQVNWLGAPYTGGVSSYDYILSDAVTRPGNGWCSEAEVLMPGSYFVFSHVPEPPVAPPRASLGLPEQRFVFANLGTPVKISPDIFDRWMRILAACPDSVLWLLANSPACVLNLKREAEWRGIDPRRLLFVTRTNPVDHMARQGAADLFLDTPYITGHTTMAESLWAGTPGISVLGETFAGRVGGSLLQDAGLPELVAPDWDAFEALAIALYQDRPRLAALRERLASSRHQLHCVDVHGQAQRMEKAFRQMHERRVQGLPAADFAVDDLLS
ncbi:MAG: tetratricopeptide repeat protein [Moraxellaceae bacterium]|nr:tetratricopeptide repeat protein [Moraxellaceae bacterium]